jgi:hypothetical protein
MPLPGGGETSPGEPSPSEETLMTTTTVTDTVNRKEVNDVGVLTTWTTLLDVSNSGAQSPTFFVWGEPGAARATRLRFDYSYNGVRWFTSINGSGTSICMGAKMSILVTPMDYTNDTFVPAPYIRLKAKKITARESMNASAWWPDSK